MIVQLVILVKDDDRLSNLMEDTIGNLGTSASVSIAEEVVNVIDDLDFKDGTTVLTLLMPIFDRLQTLGKRILYLQRDKMKESSPEHTVNSNDRQGKPVETFLKENIATSSDRDIT